MSTTTTTSSTHGLPEFSLAGKSIVVTGGARGLGLTQAEALLEAGAKVYALDVLPAPADDYHRIAKQYPGISYHQVDVRQSDALHKLIDSFGPLNGLIAAAGIQQEKAALEYTAEVVSFQDDDPSFASILTFSLFFRTQTACSPSISPACS